jgi:hypothetical protein
VHRRAATAGVCVVPSHRATACHCPTAQDEARVPGRLRLSECLGGDRRREGSPSSWRPPSRRYSAPCPIPTGPARSSLPPTIQEDRVGGAEEHTRSDLEEMLDILFAAPRTTSCPVDRQQRCCRRALRAPRNM